MLISDYKDYHVGERCFILGSGPSIGKQDLSLLKNEITYCCNWFFNHELFKDLNVNYYCAYDDDFFHNGINKKWYDQLDKFEMVKFFPEHWREHNLGLSHICYVPYIKDNKIYELNEFDVNPDKGFYDGATVIINFCLPLAIHMGFKEIILLGCDCDYGINKHGDMRKAYFYDSKHHHAPYSHTPDSEVEWQDRIFRSYSLVEDYAKSNNIQISNATLGGYLEIFDRVIYEELFAREVA